MIEEDEFLEWAHVHNHYYGTSRHMLETAVAEGRDLLLDIDVQGAAKVRKQIPAATSIFIMPPSMEALRERLMQRQKDPIDQIYHRIETARQEIRHYGEFEFVIINDDLAHAYLSLLKYYSEPGVKNTEFGRKNSIYPEILQYLRFLAETCSF